MAFKYGSTNVFPGVIPQPTEASRGAALFSNGTEAYWAYPGDPNTNVGSGFRYRSIYTHGFTAGGYKGSNPWRNINKTWHATDITYNCGDQMDMASAYHDGGFGDYNAWVFGTANSTHSYSSSHTSSYNLHNGTGRTTGGSGFSSVGIPFGYEGNDPKNQGFDYGSAGFGGDVGGWDMSVARGSASATSVDIQGQKTYITGGGSSVTNKFHNPTEIMYTTTDSGMGGGHSTGSDGSAVGLYSVAGARKYINYSNDAWTGASGNYAPDGICKFLSTKWGHHYCGNGGNVTIGMNKVNESNGATISTFNKVRSYGEENHQTGQDWGYLLGQYDGQQNNHTVKTTFATDAQLQLGAASQPKGHYGSSSAAMASAAATITAAYVA